MKGETMSDVLTMDLVWTTNVDHGDEHIHEDGDGDYHGADHRRICTTYMIVRVYQKGFDEKDMKKKTCFFIKKRQKIS